MTVRCVEYFCTPFIPRLNVSMAFAGCGPVCSANQLKGGTGMTAQHIVFVVGEGEYESARTMPDLARHLECELGARCTVLVDRNIKSDAWDPRPGQRDSDISGLETLEHAHLAVFYLRFRTLPEDQAARIESYVQRGGAVAGFRTSTHAFNYNKMDSLARFNDFGKEVFGAPWIRHYGHDSSTVVRVPAETRSHPILAGVAPEFAVRSWLYHVKPDFPPPGSTELLMGYSVGPGKEPETQRTPNPVAWTKTTNAGGRVFFTTLGHPEDFAQEPVRRLAVNGMRWALGG